MLGSISNFALGLLLSRAVPDHMVKLTNEYLALGIFFDSQVLLVVNDTIALKVETVSPIYKFLNR